mmetsp:Transcript_7387/g.13754  ORF Transcript_7387/g.13754 Transcript_7387/m.13754 type:complete len:253 (+) Transcript_7387:38-796(+)
MARKANQTRYHSHKISIDTDNYGALQSEKRTRRQSMADSSLSEYSNSFLQETDRISQIDDSLRGDIDRKYRNSTSNTNYVFPRIEHASHKRTLSQPESMPQVSPLKLIRLQEPSMQRLPIAKQSMSSLVKSKSQQIRKPRSHTPQKQRPIQHSHTQSSSTYDLMKATQHRSTNFKTIDLTSSRLSRKKKLTTKSDISRLSDIRLKASPYKLGGTPAKLRIPEQPRLNLHNKSQARVGKLGLLKGESRSLLKY